MKVAALRRIVTRSLVSWFQDEAASMGAAIAFYTLFSIAPILLIAIWIAGAFIEPHAVQSHILAQMKMLLGDTGAAAVQTLLVSAKYGGKNLFSTVVGIVTLLIGATSVFAELQNSLNRIWRTPTTRGNQGLLVLIRTRLLSFGLVLGVGFLLLVSLILSAALEGVGAWLGGYMTNWQRVMLGLDTVVGLSITSVLFAMIYKYVPRQEISWRDVWVGAMVTSALFMFGKFVIVVYLSRVAFTSAYGAAGSFVVLLLWVYYSAQIFLLGAEFTYSYAYERGSRLGQTQQRAVHV